MVELCSGVVHKILELNKKYPKREWISGLCETNDCIDICTEPCVGSSHECRLTHKSPRLSGTVHKHPGTDLETPFFSEHDLLIQIIHFYESEKSRTECVTGIGIVRCNHYKDFNSLPLEIHNEIRHLVSMARNASKENRFSSFVYDNYHDIQRIHDDIVEKEVSCSETRSGRIKCYETEFFKPETYKEYYKE